MRTDRLADPGPASGPSDDPGGTVPVEPAAIRSQEDRPLGALADGQVDRPSRARCQREGDDLAALAGHGQRPVATFYSQELDAGAGSLRNRQPVQGEQGDQRVLGWRPEPGGDQERAEFVAVQPDGTRLIVQPGTADMSGRRMVEEFLFDGVFVEARDGAQAAGDGGPGPVAGFQVASKALDVGAAGLEQADVMLVAPAPAPLTGARGLAAG